MKWDIPAMWLGLVGAALTAADQQGTWDFGKDDAGELPAGWKADSAGDGTGSVWKVVEDGTAPSRAGYVLAQTAASPKAFISLCVAEDTHYQAVGVPVLFKPLPGPTHQHRALLPRAQHPH